MGDKEIYRLNDDISFRKCSLFDDDKLTFGDCTNFSTLERNWRTYYSRNQDGIHFHCTVHPEIELEIVDTPYSSVVYQCPKCRKNIEIENLRELKSRCLRMLNIPEFKDAKLVRLDDWYVHEIKERKKDESGYWITTNVLKQAGAAPSITDLLEKCFRADRPAECGLPVSKPRAHSAALKLAASRALLIFAVIAIRKISACVAVAAVAGRFAVGLSFYVLLVESIGKGVSVHSECPLFNYLI